MRSNEAELMDNSQEYVEIADERGLFVSEHPELAAKLRTLGVPVDDRIIPSIRSVSQLDGSVLNTTTEDCA